MKLNKCHIISSRDGHFSVTVNRVINAWNTLSYHSVTSPGVACFENKIA